MTKNQLAVMRQETRLLAGRRAALEGIAMGFVPMLQASLLERRFRKGWSPVYYLSVPHKGGSRHKYVRKGDVEAVSRQTAAWREFSRAMAEWVRISRKIEALMRRIGSWRSVKINVGGTR